MFSSRLSYVKSFFWILLLPASFVWGAYFLVRRKVAKLKDSYQSRIFTLCIGNIHSGGTGKTPIVLACLERFGKNHPCVLSRGYRGKLSKQGSILNRNLDEGWHLYGDEPWMIGQRSEVPIYIGKNRVQQIKKIEQLSQSKMVLMDDGFQHLKLRKHFNTVVIPASTSWKLGACLPYGELRESLGSLTSADSILITYGQNQEFLEEWEDFLHQYFPHLPYFKCPRKMVGLFENGKEVTLGNKVYLGAFSALARNSEFLKDLSVYGRVCELGSFRDHYNYSARSLSSVVERGLSEKVTHFVTTEKDYYKVKHHFKKERLPLLVARISYEIPEEFFKKIEEKIEENALLVG